MSMVINKNFIRNQFIDSKSTQFLDVENPSTGEIISRVPISTQEEVDEAIASACSAFPAWSNTPVSRRVRYLFEFVELLIKNEDKIARTLVSEMGKSLPDAKAELKRAIENCECACAMPVVQQGEKLPNAAPNIDGEVLRVPIGVFAIIPPYNFPAMVPMWFLPYAIASGNTVIVKPSEIVPNTMQLIFELLQKTGIPEGVVSLVNGDKTVAKALIEDPRVAGICFVGSTRVAKEVASKCGALGKRFIALGSAKNHLVVMPDANIEETVRNMVTSCYGCAGQRCMAASVIVPVGDTTYETILSRFVDASKKVPIGDPLDPQFENEPMLMGPVISAKHKAFILDMIQKALEEGAKIALDGRDYVCPNRPNGYFLSPTILCDVKPGSLLHTTEVFGPVVAVIKAQSLDEAIRIINEHPYGNGASIYTRNGYYARKFKMEVKAGMIGINIGIPAPVAFLPFGGTKASAFCDIKVQGKEIVHFFTESRIVTERFFVEEQA